jgi:hypothetical protein
MGQGEYGGNGSVHWTVIHGNGRSINVAGNGRADGVDDDPRDANGPPPGGGVFKVTVEDVAQNAINYNAASRTLTVSVPIKHGPNYTRQVTIKWPQ